jgi:hypothetical protein
MSAGEFLAGDLENRAKGGGSAPIIFGNFVFIRIFFLLVSLSNFIVHFPRHQMKPADADNS